jgi:carbon-monoxide dehydrogenase small subunit
MADVILQLTVNGRVRRAIAEPRLTLADFLRERLQLTGTHLGCEHGVCGACTILLDGEAVRSCLVFAVQADGAEFITTVTAFLRDNPDPTNEQIREALSGNLCRCTGYQGILKAVRSAATALAAGAVNQETR